MKLERRLKRLEIALVSQEEKRRLMTAMILALRSALIGFTPLIAASSTFQHSAAKSLAMDRLSSSLLAGEFPADQAEGAIAALEDLFYEIDAARNAADQMPARLS